MLFDTHAHYDDEAFDTDRDALLTLQKKLLEKKAYGGYAHE